MPGGTAVDAYRRSSDRRREARVTDSTESGRMLLIGVLEKVT
ncbi:MAG: hypothetical protein ACOH19_07345 [Rhodoglobus sp.]